MHMVGDTVVDSRLEEHKICVVRDVCLHAPLPVLATYAAQGGGGASSMWMRKISSQPISDQVMEAELLLAVSHITAT
jgi:hypothetical protein